MATSIGGAAADGLSQGMQMGLGIANSQRQQQRQEAQDEIDATQRARINARQDQMDQGAALDAQGKALALEGTGYTDNPDTATPAAQADFTTRVNGWKQARDTHLSKISGYVAAAQKQAPGDIQQLTADGVSSLAPGQLTRAVTVSTALPPTAFLRSNGTPSPVEQAGQQFIQGIQNGDTPALLQGANTLFAGQLTGPQAGIGQPSPHGGTIVKKEVVGMVPAPNSDPQNPAFIPTIRTYVAGNSELNGPHDTGSATGYYDAPMTQDRSSSPSAPVKTISMKDAMEFVGQNLHLAELLNQPEGLAQLQKDQTAGPGAFDASQYLHALNAVGVNPQKAVTTNTVVPQGATLVSQSRDASGKLISTTMNTPTDKTIPQDPAIAKNKELALKQKEWAAGQYQQGLMTSDEYKSAISSADVILNSPTGGLSLSSGPAAAPPPAAAGAPPTPTPAGPTPARGFNPAPAVRGPNSPPGVTPAAQAAADSDSLRILQSELQKEQGLLPGTQNSAADPNAVARRQGNIVALQNEIKRTQASAAANGAKPGLGAPPAPASAAPTLGGAPAAPAPGAPAAPAAPAAAAGSDTVVVNTPASGAAPATGTPAAPNDGQLHGEDYLATLAPQRAALIRMVAKGEYSLKDIPEKDRAILGTQTKQFDPTANPAAGTQGSREAVMNNRVITAGNQAALDLQNVARLPLTASSGFFGGRKQGPGLLDAGREVLANTLTSQEAQSYNVLSAGFQRTLAAIEASGLAPNGSLIHAMDAVVAKEGDTNFTKMERLAQTAQIINGGLETMMTNPRLPPSTRDQVKTIMDKVTKAVPYTQGDLLDLQQAQLKDPNTTLKQILAQKAASAATASPASTKTPSGATVSNW